MSDNRELTGGQDRSRISMSESYEVDYWKNKFNVSAEELSNAVDAVGNNAEDVEIYLRGTDNNRNNN